VFISIKGTELTDGADPLCLRHVAIVARVPSVLQFPSQYLAVISHYTLLILQNLKGENFFTLPAGED